MSSTAEIGSLLEAERSLLELVVVAELIETPDMTRSAIFARLSIIDVGLKIARRTLGLKASIGVDNDQAFATLNRSMC